MDNIKIILPSGELDLTKDFGFGINISVDDLNDISKKNSAYSKTILLPGTKNNNQILGGLFDVNSTFTFFNPNFKTEARLMLNGTVILDGFMQLLEINKVNTNDLQGNEIQYSVRIQDNVIDFYEEIGEAYLINLDWGGDEYVYDFTKEEVVNSWTQNTWNNKGYVFPLMWKNDYRYAISDFKPAIFHKHYLTKIFEDTGYTVGGTFYENNTDYEKEIIPYNGDVPKRSTFDIDSGTVCATGNGYLRYTFGSIPEGGVPNKVSQNVYLETTFVPFGLVGNSTNNNYNQYDVNVLGFNDSTSEGCTSAIDRYDEVNGIFTITNTGFYNIGGQMDVDIEWDTKGVETWKFNVRQYSFNERTNYTCSVYMYINGDLKTTRTSTLEMPRATGGQLGDSTFNNGNGYKVTHTTSLDLSFNNIKLYRGDEISYKVKLKQVPERNKIANYRNCGSTSYCGSRTPIDITTTFKDTSFLSVRPSTDEVSEGDTVFLSRYVPRGLKMKDLLQDIIKRYNLIIRVDPDNPKRILLDARDDYYGDNAPVIDWTQKKDYNQKDNIKLLSELQNKEMLFTYSKAKDDDLLNKDYSDDFKDETIYGQKRIEYDNDFVKGTKKIQTPFSPTVMTYNSNDNPGMIVPYIDTSAPKTNPRVLHWGGLKFVTKMEQPASSSNDSQPRFEYVSTNDEGVESVTTSGSYPYAGHFDDPFSPTLDINYGVNEITILENLDVDTRVYAKRHNYFYSEYDKIPSNNLYNTYWRKTVEQISEGKLVTSYFHLTEIDINYIKRNLNAKIWIKDSYYNINKIIDYNPLGNGLTKVELIKVLDGFSIAPDDTTNKNERTKEDVLQKSKGFLEEATDKTSKTTKKTDDTIEAAKSKSLGEKNRIGKGCIFSTITGKLNSIDDKSPYGTILGSEETKVFAEKGTIISSILSQIEKGAKQSVMIACEGKTISSPNTVKMSANDDGEGLEVQPTAIKIDDGVQITKKEIKINDNYILSSPNVVDGGLEEVRTMFPSNRYNVIEGGINELRTPFPKNIPHTLDGGEDSL